LYAFLDTFSPGGGQTEIGLVVACADYTSDLAALSELRLYCFDVVGAVYGLSTPISVSVADNPGVGPEVTAIFNVQADTTRPAWVLIPANWAGIRSATGAAVTSVENMGTGTDSRFLAAVQPAA